MEDPIQGPAPQAAPPLAAEKTIVLDKPIKLGDIEYGQIDLREPTAGQMEATDSKTGYAWTIALVSEVSGLTPKVVRQLPIRVLNEAAEYLVPFTRTVRPTGQPG